MKQDPEQVADQPESAAESAGDRTKRQDPVAPARRKFLRTSVIGGAATAAATTLQAVTIHAREHFPAASPPTPLL